MGSSAIAPEPQPPLRALACDELRRRIMDGEYPPGTRLVEGRLAEELGVSRNPVREALRMLEMEGFVEIQQRRGGGAIVSSLSGKEAEDTFELRAWLEALCARLAARKASEEDTAALYQTLAEAEQALADEDYRKVAELNATFHLKVLEIADNQPLERVLVPIRGRAAAYAHVGAPAVARLEWSYRHDEGERAARSLQEHRELAEAIAAGDEQTAVRINEHHVMAVRDAYLPLKGRQAEGSETSESS